MSTFAFLASLSESSDAGGHFCVSVFGETKVDTKFEQKSAEEPSKEAHSGLSLLSSVFHLIKDFQMRPNYPTYYFKKHLSVEIRHFGLCEIDLFEFDSHKQNLPIGYCYLNLLYLV